MNLFIRSFVIILGIVVGYVIYIKYIETSILIPLCLINTNQCVKINYYNIDNSVLFNMEPTGYWCWYNGNNAYIYGITSGRLCSNKDYEPAYVIDLNSPSGKPKGYECIQNLDILKKYYSDNSKLKYIFVL